MASGEGMQVLASDDERDEIGERLREAMTRMLDDKRQDSE